MSITTEEPVTKEEARRVAALLAMRIARNAACVGEPDDFPLTERFPRLNPWPDCESIDGEPE